MSETTPRVLVVGGGAREHALCWAVQRDGAEVLCAPGNAGIASVARCVDVSVGAVEAMVGLALAEHVDLVIVGPEAPLVDGLTDALRAEGVAVFGPSAAAARLEGSKIFSKDFMKRHGVPTAAYHAFDDADEAAAYICAAARPLVVKADGLAAGKGVVVASTTEQARQAVDDIMRGRAFGEAGARVLVEECLKGEEVSYHVIASGEAFVPLAPAQDHKRIFDGDRGPNTGGMGAYSPVPIVDALLEQKILERVVRPTLAGMVAEGEAFTGALFIGLMIVNGEPEVLEYNVRFGDPESEALVCRLGHGLLPLLLAAAEGRLEAQPPLWEHAAALSVVLASGGYPGPYGKGVVIEGVDEASDVPGVVVFHAGTARHVDALVTAGGRVLTLTAVGRDVNEAAKRAYAAAECVRFAGKQYRTDIGYRARTP